MDFRAVKAEKLSEKVANEIVEMIDSGQLKPGDKLPTETRLARMLGTSRGTLREALTLLQYRGYISRKPKDGTYIRNIRKLDSVNRSIISTIKEATYRDLIEMREPLEQRIVELAILRGSPEQKQRIADYLESMKNSDDAQLKHLDFNFHLKLAELTDNVLLINFINMYYDLIHELGESSYKDEARKKQMFEEHRTIIQAIINNDVEGAKEAMRKHLSMIGSAIRSNKKLYDQK